MPFQPGVSGNPQGRPPGAKGLAKYIRSQTNDLRDVADFMVKVFKGEITEVTVTKDGATLEVECGVRERMDAAKWLAERGVGAALKAEALADDGTDELLAALSDDTLLKHLEGPAGPTN